MVKNNFGLGQILFIFCLSLSGCATTNLSSTNQVEVDPVNLEKPTTATQVEEIKPVEIPVGKSYQYGRFTVESDENGQKIIGGEFVPNQPLPYVTNQPHVIFVNYTTKELSYYRQDKTGNYVAIIGYAVVTPDANALPKELVRGTVTQIDMAPTWCPTKSAREKYPKLPKGCLAFGHPENEMGAAKFIILWHEVKGYEAVRLHGTKGYANGNFWEDQTLGCTRLQDEAIKNLINLLGPSAVKEGIEVILYKDNPLSLYVF